jgi:hypothetical protein
MPFWNQKQKPQQPISNQQNSEQNNKKVESTVISIEDLQQTENKNKPEELETFIDEETINANKPEVLDETTEVEDEEVEDTNIENTDTDDDPEVLALKQKLEALKESKIREKEVANAKRLAELAAKQNQQQIPIQQQMPAEQLVFLDNFGMLKLIYERINILDMKVSAMMGSNNE